MFGNASGVSRPSGVLAQGGAVFNGATQYSLFFLPQPSLSGPALAGTNTTVVPGGAL